MNNFFSMYKEIIANSTNSVSNFFLLITMNLNFFIIIFTTLDLCVDLIKEIRYKKVKKENK